MIVEFVGCTGAGKTLLISEVQQRLAEYAPVTTSFYVVAAPLGLSRVSDRMIRNFIQEVAVLPTFIRTLDRNKAIIAFTLRMLMRQPKFSIYMLNNIRGIERKIGVYEKIKGCNCSGVILVDEGTVHLAHKVFVFNHVDYTHEEIATFASLIPLPDLIIYIRAPVETLVKRTLQRSDPPREIRNNRLLTESYITRACAMFEQIIQDKKMKSRVLIVENPENTGKEFNNLADHVARFILNFAANHKLTYVLPHKDFARIE